MTLPIDRVVTLLGNDAAHPTIRTMLAALWVDRGNGIAARPLLAACHYVAQAKGAKRTARAARVLAHCASDEKLQAFLDEHVPDDDWLEAHHEIHIARMHRLRPPPVIIDTGGVERWNPLDFMDRVDSENESTVTCRCGESFTWEGFADGLEGFVIFHTPHMMPKCSNIEGACENLVEPPHRFCRRCVPENYAPGAKTVAGETPEEGIANETRGEVDRADGAD